MSEINNGDVSTPETTSDVSTETKDETQRKISETLQHMTNPAKYVISSSGDIYYYRKSAWPRNFLSPLMKRKKVLLRRAIWKHYITNQ